MNIRTLVTNGVLAALYIAVTAIIAPFGFTNIQFRVSEMFNHLIVFNRKYFWGIITGVFIANLFMSTLGAFEVLGLLLSVVLFAMSICVCYFVINNIIFMVYNIIYFT